MSGHDLATAIAHATGGVVRALATEPEWPSFGVEVAPAGCAVLVRDHGHVVTISVGDRAWHVARGEPLPADLPDEARRWASSHSSETTLTDAALALAPILQREFGEPWVLSIPGGQPAPTEMWLHPSGDTMRASVGIFADGIRVDLELVSMSAVVEHVRAQLAAYERNVALSKECANVAADLAARLGKCAATTGSRFASYFGAVVSAVVDGQREIARIEARDGVVMVSAGLPDESGWHGTAEQALANASAIARAAEAMQGVVTYDTLEYGARYRVVAAFEGLREGEVVEYGGPIDNHAPHAFKRENGEEVLVDEWALRRSVHRVLAR